jgi:hypothetical protein
MRANRRLSSLLVVLVGLCGGCSPVEDSPDTVAPVEPLAPPPAPSPPQAIDEERLRRVEQLRAGSSQSGSDQIREAPANVSGPTQVSSESAERALPPPVRRLFFQCTDEVGFAVETIRGLLAVFPPGHSNGYIILTQQPSDSGLYYTGGDAELRMERDLATLHVGRDRYVDCVSNPAAATWEDPRRGGTPTR